MLMASATFAAGCHPAGHAAVYGGPPEPAEPRPVVSPSASTSASAATTEPSATPPVQPPVALYGAPPSP